MNSLLYGDGRGQVTYNFALVVDHDYAVSRPASGQYGWIDGGESAAYNTPGDIASDHPQSLTVVVDPMLPTPTPTNTTDKDKKDGGNECGDAPAMARYSVHSMLVSLNIEDRPLRYTPPRGPAVDFLVTYDQKDKQPAAFTFSNLGPKWTFGWLAYVSDDPLRQPPQTAVYVPNGGTEIYSFDQTSLSFLPHPQSHATLVKTGAATYERLLPDGSKQIFALSDGASAYPRKIFMTQIVDAAGNALTIGYDASFRITTLTDALGLVTTLAYELPGDTLKITKVTDPFGRFATFQYTAGQLTTITDEIGIQSQFTYTSGTDSINSLATPYGTTNFSSGENGTNRWVEITDPVGAKERVEYRDNAPGISASDPVAPNATGITNSGLDVANTFYWDKKAMVIAPGDYTKAKITHWLYSVDGSLSGIPSSEKSALENRVWYTYAGQPDYTHAGPSANPSQVARVLGDGSTQLSQFEYNPIGKTTKATDPVGRVTTSIYDTNSIDPLEIRQMIGTNNELLRKFTYNGLHEPLTDTDAAGQGTILTYNTYGQMLTRQNAKFETTTFAYGGTVPTGYLASITSPLFNGNSAVTSFAYDSFNRVRTVTDTDGYAVTTDYDNLDRKTKATYLDATYEQFQYTDNVTGAMKLDLTGSRDRRGLWTYRHYNANRQMDSMTDPANRTTQYGWCMCGALETITDPKNQITTFNRDIQGRVYQKIFNDGTAINYLYEGQTAPNTVGAMSRM
ncbi:MAG: RHS repeat protein [Chthoniobacterales bacterium]|nr:RHS repeat protein [Chthoniobacterales bacterium]